MKGILLTVCTAAMFAASSAMAQQKSVKVGFIGTFTGPAAVIGNDMRNALELALDHLGRRMAGLPVNVIYEDDQQKPEVGKQKTVKLIESDRVDFLVGYIWSNVLLASFQTAIDAQTFLISSNAGPPQLAGEMCSPYFFSTSWQNDQTPQTIGHYLNTKNVKTLYLLAPNYAAGRDIVGGVRAVYKGAVVGQDLTRWPNQLDFSVELTKVRSVKPEAVFAFYPGGAGVQFLSQYIQAGLRDQIPLYTHATIDALSLPRLKELALGVPSAQSWVNDLPNEANKKFVADFKVKHKNYPSFYGAQTYDAVNLINSGVVAVKGDLSKKDEMRDTFRQAAYSSVRGRYRYGNNHFPIQNFYVQEAVKDADGMMTLHTISKVLENNQDEYAGKCPMKW